MSGGEDMVSKIKPIIFWSGFPVCALLIKKVADRWGNDLVILGTKAATPFVGLEKTLGHEIVWLDDANDIWKYQNRFNDRNFIIHSGWMHESWLRYDHLMKERNGAKVVVAVDNRFRGDARQFLGAAWFRVRLRRHFDAALVPGRSGRKLMRFFGMPADRIFTGLYGAYEGIFKETTPIEARMNEFLFVGQLNRRKSIDVLVAAFKNYRRRGGTWKLRIVGEGPQKALCEGEGITLEPFAQPDQVAAKMNAAKVFILPSRDDNWGTVVCEAAACGMHIVSTKPVAASEDIIENNVNGFILENIDPVDLEQALFACEKLSLDQLKQGSLVSKDIAAHYNSEAYFQAFMKMTETL